MTFGKYSRCMCKHICTCTNEDICTPVHIYIIIYVYTHVRVHQCTADGCSSIIMSPVGCTTDTCIIYHVQYTYKLMDIHVHGHTHTYMSTHDYYIMFIHIDTAQLVHYSIRVARVSAQKKPSLVTKGTPQLLHRHTCTCTQSLK